MKSLHTNRQETLICDLSKGNKVAAFGKPKSANTFILFLKTLLKNTTRIHFLRQKVVLNMLRRTRQIKKWTNSITVEVPLYLLFEKIWRPSLAVYNIIFMFRHLHKCTVSVTTNYLALFNQNESDVWTNMEANHAASWILPAGWPGKVWSCLFIKLISTRFCILACKLF